jgi:hypothetical protein
LIATLRLTNFDYINAAECFDSVCISQRLAHGWSAIRVYQGDSKMRHALAVILLFVVGSANAATIVYAPDGDVTGIGGLDIGGTLYNVDFETGAYSTFGGVEDFWTTQAEGVAAINTINALLNANLPANCEVNNSTSDSGSCTSFSAYRYSVNIGAGNATHAASYVDFFDEPHEPWSIACTSCEVTNISPVTAWSVVPLPAAVWLFGSALAGLGWFRRRQTA